MLVAFALYRVAIRLAGGQGFTDFAEIGCATGDRRDQIVDRAVCRAKPAIQRRALALAPVQLAADFRMIFAHQQRYRVGCEQLLRQAGENPFLQLDPIDARGVRAGAFLTVTGTGEARACRDGVAAAAFAAMDEAGQQISGALLSDDRSARPRRGGILHAMPQVFRNYPQLRHLDRQAIGRCVDSGDALPAFGIADHPDPVIEIPAGVDRVVQDADAPLPRTVDRRRLPVAAARGPDAIGIEALGDRLRAATGIIFFVDPPDDRRLLLVDCAKATLQFAIVGDARHDVIAIGHAAGRSAALDRASLTAPDLVGEIFQEERGHRAFQPDVQLVHLAFGQRVNLHACEDSALVDSGDVLLVAREAVDRFGADDVECAGAGVREHSRHARSPIGRAGNGNVTVDADDLPAFAFGSGGAGCDLVFGRVRGLFVGREASVDCATWHERLREG